MNAHSPTAPSVTVHPAETADLPEVHRMLVALAAHHGDIATLTPGQLAGLLQGPEARALVACLPVSPARHPVGYALITRRHEMISGHLLLDITHLYVQPPFRSQGIARALIVAAQVLARAENAARLTIGSHPGNPAAAAAYRQMGLQEMPTMGPRFAVPLG